LNAAAAPSRTHAAHFSSEPAVAMMWAPVIFAICSAAMPMPLPAAWIITHSPARRPPRTMSWCHAVL
jgi:hypothetical protein